MKSKHIPYRRCIGCMESRPQSELMRIVSLGKEIAIDVDGTLPGRGAYLCKTKECLEKAIKKRSFQRVFKGEISIDALLTNAKED